MCKTKKKKMRRKKPRVQCLVVFAVFLLINRECDKVHRNGLASKKASVERLASLNGTANIVKFDVYAPRISLQLAVFNTAKALALGAHVGLDVLWRVWG